MSGKKKYADVAAKVNQRLMKDHAYYCKNNLMIEPKKGSNLVPLQLNVSQLYVNAMAEAQLEEHGHVALLILKARQQGMSTWSQSRAYGMPTRHPNWTSLTMVHLKSAAENIANMASRFYENDKLIRPVLRKGTYSRDEMLFENPANSRYLVRTAGTQAEGRSYKINLYHASEVAFWPANGAQIIGGLQEAMPSGDDPMTWELWETTANGFDPLFQPKWEEVEGEMRKGTNPKFLQVFLPWFFHKEYTRSLSPLDTELLLDTMTAEEVWLLNQKDPFGRSPSLGQLMWRRRKIADMTPPPAFTKEEFFKQEYPSTSEEAFLSTGRVVFDRDKLQEMRAANVQPLVKYNALPDTFTMIADPKGELWVLQEPRPGVRYVIGIDVAEGLDHGDGSSIDVIVHASRESVAHWHGRIATEALAGIAATIGRRYNNALLAVERNNHGVAVLNKLISTHYPNLYNEMAVDQPGAAPRKRFGWVTTSRTKPILVDRLITDMESNQVGPLFHEQVMEFMSFEAVTNDANTNVKYRAQPGKCDDRVLSLGIAHTVAEITPITAVPKPSDVGVNNKPKQWGNA